MSTFSFNDRPELMQSLQTAAEAIVGIVGAEAEELAGKETTIIAPVKTKEGKEVFVVFNIEMRPKGVCMFCDGTKTYSQMTATGVTEETCRHCKGTGTCPEPKCKCHHPVV